MFSAKLKRNRVYKDISSFGPKLIEDQVASILVALAPLATILIFVNYSDKRFTDMLNASDKRFADSQTAAEKRFADSQTAIEKRFADSQTAAEKRVTDADKRFTDSLVASEKRVIDADKRFTDSQKAADQRFADLIASMKEIKISDKEVLNVVLGKLTSEISRVEKNCTKS